MAWNLAPDVSYCRIGNNLLFLDLKRDRYFALGGRDRTAFEALCARRPVAPDCCERLSACGIIRVGTSGRGLEPASIIIPEQDIHMLAPASFSPRGLFATTVALLWARHAATSGRLCATIETIRRRKVGSNRGAAPSDATGIACRFEANRAFAPVSRRCLIDSLALMHLCLSHNIAPTWVFGVRTEPFAAHCWLQHGEYILSCAADDALGFTPILVV
jgi:hypothetical protein